MKVTVEIEGFEPIEFECLQLMGVGLASGSSFNTFVYRDKDLSVGMTFACLHTMLKEILDQTGPIHKHE
jgi:hypothetical protein